MHIWGAHMHTGGAACVHGEAEACTPTGGCAQTARCFLQGCPNSQHPTGNFQEPGQQRGCRHVPGAVKTLPCRWDACPAPARESQASFPRDAPRMGCSWLRDASRGDSGSPGGIRPAGNWGERRGRGCFVQPVPGRGCTHACVCAGGHVCVGAACVCVCVQPQQAEPRLASAPASLSWNKGSSPSPITGHQMPVCV